MMAIVQALSSNHAPRVGDSRGFDVRSVACQEDILEAYAQQAEMIMIWYWNCKHNEGNCAHALLFLSWPLTLLKSRSCLVASHSSKYQLK